MLPPLVDMKKIYPFACQHPSSLRNRAPPAASPSTNTADRVCPETTTLTGTGSGFVIVTHSTGSATPTVWLIAVSYPGVPTTFSIWKRAGGRRRDRQAVSASPKAQNGRSPSRLPGPRSHRRFRWQDPPRRLRGRTAPDVSGRPAVPGFLERCRSAPQRYIRDSARIRWRSCFRVSPRTTTNCPTASVRRHNCAAFRPGSSAADELALSVWLDLERHGATSGIRVKCEGSWAVVRLESIVQDPRARRRASRRSRTQRIAGLSVFMVAHQQHVAIGQRKRRHAVHRLRGRESVVHRIPFIADDPVLEPCGQRQIVASGAGADRSRPESAVTSPVPRRGGPGDQGIKEGHPRARRLQLPSPNV